MDGDMSTLRTVVLYLSYVCILIRQTQAMYVQPFSNNPRLVKNALLNSKKDKKGNHAK